MIKESLKFTIERAIEQAIKEGQLGSLSACPVPVVIEMPRLPEHGDFACGVALKLASAVKSSPLRIAETIAKHVEAPEGCISSLQVAAPGFLNFHLGPGWLQDSLFQIIQSQERYGRSQIGHGRRILIEYVSANPTGDLHIGHGRNAVYGSCLSNLLSYAGYQVEQEFYINDAGEQIAQLGRCAWALYQRKLGCAVDYPSEGYPEASLSHYLDDIIAQHGKAFLGLPDQEGTDKLGHLAQRTILETQEKLLGRLRVHFDSWFSETTLHQEKMVAGVLDKFAHSSLTYESEGALWLKAKELGDERDRVLRKSNGALTYLAADAAYHLEKFHRGYDRLINIWGADHHGQVPGLKAVVQALGEDPERLEIILTQIVNLCRDGQMVRMSKRMGTVVTLSEVMDEVGVDAVRYYLAESNPQNPINFDLALAKQTSKENPAFYIQYAHARCCAILRKALEPGVDTHNGQVEPAPISAQQWQEFCQAYQSSPSVFQDIFEQSPQVYTHQKNLIMRLDSFPAEVEEAALARTPGRLARYAYELANDLQKFYEVCRVITPDLPVTRARLGLIVATRQVLANVLGLIGVAAPDRM